MLSSMNTYVFTCARVAASKAVSHQAQCQPDRTHMLANGGSYNTIPVIHSLKQLPETSEHAWITGMVFHME